MTRRLLSTMLVGSAAGFAPSSPLRHQASALVAAPAAAAGLQHGAAFAAAPVFLALRCQPAVCRDGGGSDGSAHGSAAASPLSQLPQHQVKAPRRIRSGEGSEPRNGRSVTRVAGRRGTQRNVVREQGKATQVRELQRLHITGGTARGRRIVTPDVYMRPMMSRVREALYSVLQMTGVLRPSAAHLDLFSGAGTVGLESLSRGIGTATFVDFSRVCAQAIRENAAAIGFGDRATVLEARVDAVLLQPAAFGLTRPFELVTVTPPYEEVVYADLVELVANSPLVDEDTLVVFEYPVELGCFPPTLADGRLVGLRNRKYGRTVLGLYVYRPSGRLGLQPFSEEFVTLDKK
jgi:16S rRNA (guanine(966)-N(2))-methyltransferase RsmD|eukprot:jgi/Chrpa1/14333/Chrysochromulina_OHIO_Genome00020197-RA